MKRQLAVSGLLAALLLIPATGCTPDKPVDKKKIASDAGQLAALTYLAVQKPSIDDAKAVKKVIDEIVVSLDKYEEGGFKTALPRIKEAIRKAFPKEDQKALRLLGDKLAETLLDELDALFERHPEWKKLGQEVAVIVSAFCSGASKGFEEYIKES